MRNPRYFSILRRRGGTGIALTGAFLLLIGANQASALTITNAFDNAADAAYSGGAFIQENGPVSNAMVAN